MNYGTIKNYDIANGTGVRVSLFVSGCRHHCKGCFNSETWDFNYGNPYTKEVEAEILEALKPAYIQGFSLLGGEPFEPENQRVLVDFLRKVRRKYSEKSIWCFTGFTLEMLETEGTHCHCEATEEMLSLIDVLVDGRFDKNKKNISLRFRGSENQRLIDLNLTRECGTLTLWNE